MFCGCLVKTNEEKISLRHYDTHVVEWRACMQGKAFPPKKRGKNPNVKSRMIRAIHQVPSPCPPAVRDPFAYRLWRG